MTENQALATRFSAILHPRTRSVAVFSSSSVSGGRRQKLPPRRPPLPPPYPPPPRRCTGTVHGLKSKQGSTSTGIIVSYAVLCVCVLETEEQYECNRDTSPSCFPTNWSYLLFLLHSCQHRPSGRGRSRLRRTAPCAPWPPQPPPLARHSMASHSHR